MSDANFTFGSTQRTKEAETERETVERCVIQPDGTRATEQYTVPKKEKKSRVLIQEEGEEEGQDKKKKKKRRSVVESDGLCIMTEDYAEEKDDCKSKIAFLKAEANYEITKIKSELARKIMEMTKE